MNMMWLEKFPEPSVLREMVFMMYVIVLFAGEFFEYWEYYSAPDRYIKDKIVEKRYRLRQRMLQYAAFQGISEYNPHPHMERLMRRLFVTYQDDPPAGIQPPTAGHIQRMNRIGADMVKVHEDWKAMIETGSRKADFRLNELDGRGHPRVDAGGQKQAALAVISLFDYVQDLHEHKMQLEAMQRLQGDNTVEWQVGLLKPEQIRLRAPIAWRIFVRDKWNFLDFVNYMLFMVSLVCRIRALNAVPFIQEEISGLNVDTMHMKYINFSGLGYWDRMQANITAFNAILTWIKLFKYLDFFPSMLMLINTLSRAVPMLGSLMITIVIVLLGAGQGFFMAFGLEVHTYRDFFSSVSGLLRMAVGDFDYTELADSNRVLGPVLFWLYIVLVFFVLMSMFIALISEAFEDAKDAQQNHGHKVMAADPKVVRYKPLTTAKLLEEAGNRWHFSSPENMGIISKKMHQDLWHFSDKPSDEKSAVNVFLKHKRETDKETSGTAPGGLAKGRSRRSSVDHTHSTNDLHIPGALGDVGSAAEAGWDNTYFGRKWRQRLYWKTDAATIKLNHEEKEVAGWFKKVEAKTKGRKYRATRTYEARDPNELSFRKNAIITVTSQPPGGHKHPITKERKEGVWKGYSLSAAHVKIVYGFDKVDDERERSLPPGSVQHLPGAFNTGGFLEEIPIARDRLVEKPVDLSDDEDDVIGPETAAVTEMTAPMHEDDPEESETEDEDSDEEDDSAGDDGDGDDEEAEVGGGEGGESLIPGEFDAVAGGHVAIDVGSETKAKAKKKPKVKRSKASDKYAVMAPPDPSYYAPPNTANASSFGETRQNEQSRKEKELEKKLVEAHTELRAMKAENEKLKLERRPAGQSTGGGGVGSKLLEARINEVAESVDSRIVPAIEASTAGLREELAQIKQLLLGGAGPGAQQLLQTGDDVAAGQPRGGGGRALGANRQLANRQDGQWVKMANVEGGTEYRDAQEYWHHTGTNAIRTSPPPGVQMLTDDGEPLPIDGVAMPWYDDDSGSDRANLLPDSYPGQVMDPVRQTRDREKARKRGQEMEALRKSGEVGLRYGARRTPTVMAMDSGGISRPEQLHQTASKVAGGTYH